MTCYSFGTFRLFTNDESLLLEVEMANRHTSSIDPHRTNVGHVQTDIKYRHGQKNICRGRE
jgi:hypothetical protein